MPDPTYKPVELVGTSSESFEDAVETAVERASRTMHGLRWFEVLDQRGQLGDGGVTEYQVRVKVWYHLDD